MVYRFGGFTLDDGARQLLSNEGEVHLSPKAFELLVLLVANRSRAVSKTELLQQLWPATFVEETNVAGLVSEIRGGLGDSAASPSFVRTVHRFGYRFVGDVTEEAAAARPDRARAKLYLVLDDRQIMLMDGANVVGRAPDATIQIDSPGVSRYHARVLVSNGEATLEDLGSKNGTYVDGVRIAQPTRLQDASEIRIGALVMTFRVTAPMSPTETA
jgi:DNA-binding winged helix-turn-helix (wHTH) protein